MYYLLEKREKNWTFCSITRVSVSKNMLLFDSLRSKLSSILCNVFSFWFYGFSLSLLAFRNLNTKTKLILTDKHKKLSTLPPTSNTKINVLILLFFSNFWPSSVTYRIWFRLATKYIPQLRNEWERRPLANQQNQKKKTPFSTHML